MQINFPTPYLQVWAIVLLAIIGGYLGCLFTSFNTWVCLVRKKWAKHIHLRILEVRAGPHACMHARAGRRCMTYMVYIVGALFTYAAAQRLQKGPLRPQ